VPPGTQPGAVLRVEGRGAPQLHYANVRGAHHVHLRVAVPTSLSEEEEALFRRLREVAEEVAEGAGAVHEADGAEREATRV